MELVLVFLVILLVFGAKRIPEIAQGIGKGITEFKKAARDVTDEIESSVNERPANTATRNELRGQRITEQPKQTTASSSSETKEG
jgi:sec-independent protein translocase protein TatA